MATTDSQNRWIQWVLGIIAMVILSISICGFTLRENVARHDEKLKSIDERSQCNKESIKEIVECNRKSMIEINKAIQSLSSKMSVVLYRIDDISQIKNKGK